MICIICEPITERNIWLENRYHELCVAVKKRRIEYKVLKSLKEIEELTLNEPIVVVAIGAHKEWYSYIIKQCNYANIRVITFGELFPNSFGGSYSSVTSDLKGSAMEMLKYLRAYDKLNTIVYGVNPDSEFDVRLADEIEETFLNDGVTIKEIIGNGGLKEQIDMFFENCTKCDSVICTNDYSAIVLIEAIKERKAELLKKMFFISFSNTLLSLLYSPSITTFYEADVGAMHVIRIYRLLVQDLEIGSINFSIKEHMKIRETTHFSPHTTGEKGDLSNVSESYEREEKPDISLPETITELTNVESMLANCDKMDINILILLLKDKSSQEISNILYTSRGSVRYRIKCMVEGYGFETRSKMILSLKKFVSPDSLCEYADALL
ncbi:MAG: LacI family DNA-binding transcriptional regulator [Clostridia bacterium]|nr:LacI family DNA-binding transcriptional regulator [Clostridia bacterium]